MSMKNKEQLLDFFLSGHLNLSQYDYRFMSGIRLLVEGTKRLTSNQASLFDRLVEKYRKQLTANTVDVDAALNLAWDMPVVESAKEHVSAKVFIEEDKLILRVPFNRKFITYMNQNRRAISPTKLEWNRVAKRYEAPFRTHILKETVQILPRFFDSIIYQDEIQSFLDQAASYQNQVWNPTLVEVNGRLVVLAVNQCLGEKLADLTLEKTPECLLTLCNHGVTISDTILNQDPSYRIAGQLNPTINAKEFETTIQILQDLGMTNIAFSNKILNNPHYSPIIKEKTKGATLMTARGISTTIDAYFTEASSHVISGVYKKITLIDIQ